mmetsp:Transcript_25461/g.38622  ORF Transcript_25461/g.38622 Transcript_25461/m.38622 type:complete len:85 (-) Transcript_25461:79-333(-)
MMLHPYVNKKAAMRASARKTSFRWRRRAGEEEIDGTFADEIRFSSKSNLVGNLNDNFFLLQAVLAEEVPCIQELLYLWVLFKLT